MEEAKDLGLELDVWSYSTLIKGFCQAERTKDAEEVLLAMKAHSVQPNVVSISSCVNSLAVRNFGYANFSCDLLGPSLHLCLTKNGWVPLVWAGVVILKEEMAQRLSQGNWSNVGAL